MKKYTNPELIINLITVEDVLSASTGGHDNDRDNIYEWGSR